MFVNKGKNKLLRPWQREFVSLGGEQNNLFWTGSQDLFPLYCTNMILNFKPISGHSVQGSLFREHQLQTSLGVWNPARSQDLGQKRVNNTNLKFYDRLYTLNVPNRWITMKTKIWGSAWRTRLSNWTELNWTWRKEYWVESWRMTKIWLCIKEILSNGINRSIEIINLWTGLKKSSVWSNYRKEEWKLFEARLEYLPLCHESQGTMLRWFSRTQQLSLLSLCLLPHLPLVGI